MRSRIHSCCVCSQTWLERSLLPCSSQTDLHSNTALFQTLHLISKLRDQAPCFSGFTIRICKTAVLKQTYTQATMFTHHIGPLAHARADRQAGQSVIHLDPTKTIVIIRILYSFISSKKLQIDCPSTACRTLNLLHRKSYKCTY
jgi:hypothetical protein